MFKINATFFLLIIPFAVFSQKHKPGAEILRTESRKLTLIIDSVSYGEAVVLNTKLKPDVWNFPVKNEILHVTLKSGIDSLEIPLKGGESIDLVVIQSGQDTAFLQFVGQKFTNPATFSKAYIKANNLKTIVDVSPVYELVNILIALTESAEKDKNLVYRNSAYYKKVISTFGPYKKEKMVALIDSLLKEDKYANVKMDAYSFEFKGRKIVPSKVYDRISWGALNTLKPFKKDLQDFADKTDFITFFKSNSKVYDQQESCYRDSIKLPQMVDWLRKNYPSTDYNAFKIIFSPLVAGNQSANSFAHNGFREAQAHVNFPYPALYKTPNLSKHAIDLKRGSIVFTELNHSFNDPETGKYQKSDDFKNAFSKLESWIERGKPAANYNNALACFNEYMNWGLVSLYYTDFAPEEEEAKLIRDMEGNMKKYRGFKKFPEFNQFLVALYKGKGEKPLADFYPQIIKWFADNKG